MKDFNQYLKIVFPNVKAYVNFFLIIVMMLVSTTTHNMEICLISGLGAFYSMNEWLDEVLKNNE